DARRSRIGAGSAGERVWAERGVLSQKYEEAIAKEEACFQTDGRCEVNDLRPLVAREAREPAASRQAMAQHTRERVYHHRARLARQAVARAQQHTGNDSAQDLSQPSLHIPVSCDRSSICSVM